ncbi:hypothetical protein BDN72DRAFT_458852 [Pluteus cervinus]|uniref:Uncharacterized protein n=1 Tax=Pluteus cervinus TaxID=181527 RepID=A0ACD3AZM0_9AGAR|nr:hypothetical protein BDN72DRAFT_458852 [Pluteus cervinus]
MEVMTQKIERGMVIEGTKRRRFMYSQPMIFPGNQGDVQEKRDGDGYETLPIPVITLHNSKSCAATHCRCTFNFQALFTNTSDTENMERCTPEDRKKHLTSARSPHGGQHQRQLTFKSSQATHNSSTDPRKLDVDSRQYFKSLPMMISSCLHGAAYSRLQHMANKSVVK